jgi:lipoyl(octanoyl) transferase
MTALWAQDLASLDFATALTIQEKLVELKQRASTDDFLLFVEHPHVYTVGRGGKEANILAAMEVPVYRTSRGGDVTYHGPGQLVVYPIIDLRSKLRRDVHRYVRNLEWTAIRTLKDFGIEAQCRPPYTGIWLGARKIAALGVAVRRCVTFHGLALNVNTDLTYFRRIIPCGLTWAEVTSMQEELGAAQSVERVRERFLQHFAEIFGYFRVEQNEDGDFQSSILNPRPEAR